MNGKEGFQKVTWCLTPSQPGGGQGEGAKAKAVRAVCVSSRVLL